LWLAAHAFVLALIVGLKFLTAKAVLLMALMGAAVWFAVKRKPRFLRPV
jgi:hypothetical protein